MMQMILDEEEFMLSFKQIAALSYEEFVENAEQLYDTIVAFEIPENPEPREVNARLSGIDTLRGFVTRYSMVINPQFLKLEYIYKTTKDYHLTGCNAEARKSNAMGVILSFMMDVETYKKIYMKLPDNIEKNDGINCTRVNLMDLISEAEQKRSMISHMASMIERKHEAMKSMSYLVHEEQKVANG